MNKEEIQKAKEWLDEHIIIQKVLVKEDIESDNRLKVYITLKDYIQQLETKVKEVEKERDNIYTDYQDLGKEYHKLEEDKEKNYNKGYIQRQNEAIEICKICRYRIKLKKLEERQEKVKEELKVLRVNLEKDEFVGYADNVQEILDLYKEEENNARN